MQRWFLVLCFTMSYVSAADVKGASGSQTSFLIQNRSGKSLKAYAYSRQRHILSGDRTFTFWYPLHKSCVQNREDHLFIFKWPDVVENDLSGSVRSSIDAKVIVKGVFKNEEHRTKYVVSKQEHENKRVEILIRNPYKKSRKKDTVEKT